MSQGNLAWVDYETTGLDPDTDVPIELGIVVTDHSLKVLDQRSWVIAAEFDLDRLHERVLEMHLANGLLEAIADGKGEPLRHVEHEAITFLKQAKTFGVELESGPWRSPMCGSTIGFDRSFMARHMPALHRCFHYRNLDASSFLVLCQAQGLDMGKADGDHRAVADCLRSIALVKKCWRAIQIGGSLAP